MGVATRRVEYVVWGGKLGEDPLGRMRMWNQRTDEEILTGVASKNREAYAELYARYGSAVMGFLIKRCGERGPAEELCQDVFLTIWRRAESFDSSRGRAKTWVFTIARNKATDLGRRRTLQRAHARDPHWVQETEAPDIPLDRSEEAQRVRDALTTLPESQQEVLRRTFFESQSYPEIARSMGVALGTVKSRARLGFERLRSVLGGSE